MQYLKSGTTGNPTSLQNLSYAYDAVGNISNITNTKASETSVYGYDTLDRLTSWTLNNGTPETYGYDSATGNLSSKASTTLTYNAQVTCSAGTRTIPHAVSAASGNTYTYDCNGSQITRVIGADTYLLAYDAENRLVEVKKNNVSMAAFVYDGDGNRVKSTINGTTTSFVGAHYEVTGSQVTKYYFAGMNRIAMRKYTISQSTTLTYLLGDHLGSTSLAVDASTGEVIETRYKPWGEVRYTTPNKSLPTQYTFTGQYSHIADDATDLGSAGFGLMFYNARFYDPALGRFTSADTIVPGGVQGLDRYAYVLNNPIRYIDPTGHVCSDPEDETGGCEGGGGTLSKDYAANFYRASLKDRYDWDIASDFSEDELKVIRQTAYDIEAYVDGLTGGNGLEWMSEYLSGITISRTTANRGSAFPGWVPGAGDGIINLPSGWASGSYGSPNLYFAHELGHIWDGNTGHFGIGTVGGVADGLNIVIGGSILLSGACRFCNPGPSHGITPLDPHIPNAYKWGNNVNNGYGNGATADYLAEAFAWSAYDPTKLPDSIVQMFVDYSIIAQASALP